MRFRHAVAVAANLVLASGFVLVSPAHGTMTDVVVEHGGLSISVPTSADIGSGAPGSVVSVQLGPVTVTDERSALTATWVCSITATDFTTATAATISNTEIFYWSGLATSTTGPGTFVSGQSNSANAETLEDVRTAFSHTTGSGNNAATWSPTVEIELPDAVVTGTYRGTVIHTVL